MTTLNADATGSDLVWDDENEEMETETYSWSSTGRYVISNLDPETGEQVFPASVYSYGLTEDNNHVSIDFFDEAANIVFEFVKVTGDLDSDLVGTWDATSRTVDGTDDPDFPDSTTMILNDDGSGETTYDSEVDIFTWSTNADFVITQPEPYGGPAWSYSYTVEGNSLTSSYMTDEDGTVQNIVEVYTKQ